MSTNKRRRPSSNHQSRQRPGPAAAAAHSPALERVAALIRTQLRARRADFAPLPKLAATTGIDHVTMAATVARYPDLGITGGGEHPVIYSVDPATTVVGFEPVYRRGHMILRLGSLTGPPWPLSISGAHLGTAVNHDDPEPDYHSPYGSGELAYAIARLTLMARRWLILPDQPSSHDVTVRLFELIGRAWYAGPAPPGPAGACTSTGPSSISPSGSSSGTTTPLRTGWNWSSGPTKTTGFSSSTSTPPVPTARSSIPAETTAAPPSLAVRSGSNRRRASCTRSVQGVLPDFELADHLQPRRTAHRAAGDDAMSRAQIKAASSPAAIRP
ncbi:MAG: hypothetical protein H0W01_04935 [Pseudonocardiales bacterium]|nr:hypothetical protein [Pseudonocardiales bacterium]